MAIRDLGVEIGVDIDESPFTALNREIDEVANMMRSLDIGVLDDMERDARSLTGDFELMDSAVTDFDRSLSGIDDTNIQNVSSETNTATKAMDGLKLGVLAVIATIGGLAAGFGLFATDAEDAFGRLKAQTGASVEEMEVLKDAAYDTFSRGYGESLDEVTEAMARVKQNMHGLSDGELSDVTSNAMLLADTFGGDVNEVVRGTNNLMQAFGIESGKAFDLFTAGGQRGLNFSDEMFDNVAEYAPLFGAMGYSAEEYFGILERGSKMGVYNLDYVNDVMKEFQIRVKDGSKATGEAMKGMSKETRGVWKDFLNGKGTVSDVASKVVDELKGMEDQVEAGQIAVSLFGTKFEDLESDAVYAMLGTTDAMTDFEGATAAAADAVEGTFKNRMVGAWRELQTGILQVVDNPTAQQFFDTIATKAEELVPYLVAGVEGIIEFGASIADGTSVVNEFVETYAPFIAGLAGGVATYFVITGAIALYTGAVGLAAGATTILGGAIAFLTSPIGIAVVAIGTIIAVGVALWQNWDIVKEKAAILSEWLGEKFSTIKSNIMNSIQPVVNLFDKLMGKWDAFKEKVSNFSIGGAVDKVASFIPGFSSGIGRVPNDMIAEIHKDEAIIPAEDAQMLRDIGVIDGDGRYPNINMDNLSDTGGMYQPTKMTNATSTSVQAPVTIIIQGGNTNEETGQSVSEAIEAFFADLGAVMPQVREG